MTLNKHSSYSLPSTTNYPQKLVSQNNNIYFAVWDSSFLLCLASAGVQLQGWGCIIWKFLLLHVQGLDGDQSWSCWRNTFMWPLPWGLASSQHGGWDPRESGLERERLRDTERLSCQSYCLLGPSFGSHTVTSAILCWLRQSQKLLRFEVKEYKPLHSIGRGSVPHCKKKNNWGLPWWSSGWEPTLQCRGRGF